LEILSTIRRQSFHLGRTVAGSVGNYLPDALTEMWEPTRDFAYLKLPSSGVQSVVALSKWVLFIYKEKIFRQNSMT
jgi:autophagy-related protein 18